MGLILTHAALKTKLDLGRKQLTRLQMLSAFVQRARQAASWILTCIARLYVWLELEHSLSKLHVHTVLTFLKPPPDDMNGEFPLAHMASLSSHQDVPGYGGRGAQKTESTCVE